MRKMTVGLALLGVVYTAAADVVTNTWITPSGGKWLATNEVGVLVNWAGNLMDTNAVMNTVADFALDDRASIYTSREKAPTSGMLFRPAGKDVSGDPATWPTWYLRVERDHSDFFLSASALGHVPLRVENGRLVFGDDMGVASESALDLAPIRKEGNGDVRFSRFYRYRDSGRTLDIAEGTVFPMAEAALAYTDVRVTDPAGAFVFTNFTPRAFLGSFAPQPGVPQPLNGVDLCMGALAATTVPGEVCGTGRVTAVARSVYVTNVAPHIVYGASAGRLRLDTTDPAAVPFVHYDFEASLTADASGNGRDLTAEGDVARVYDDERGGYVARFTATAKTGGRLFVTVPDAEGLTGDADYTVSLWAKAASPCANNWPTFFSLGQTTDDRQTVQFRFMDAGCTNLLLGHWNGRGDFANIAPSRDAAAWNPAVWHHYVAMREGGFCAVWVDGRKVFERRNAGLVMTLPRTVQITLGALIGWQRFFHGDLDDVRVYAHALGSDGVARLFAGLEPVQDGTAPTRGAPPDLPEGTRLALDLNGAIQLAGAQTLAATNVTATGPRGTLDLPAGGTLTLTGPGVYPAGVSGTGRLVKDGPGRLVLGGALAQTGGTEVKAGTLVLENDATQVARVGVWDFACGLGVEAGGSGRDLTTQADVARVWDDERGGYVAEFPGTPGQRLEATLDSSMLAGDSDYTLSVWAKPAADCPAEGTLLSLGQQSDFREVVFRFKKDIASGTMVLSHWGGALDFTNVTAPAAPQGVWRHYAAVREGSRFTVYVDGVATWTETRAGALGLAAVKPLCLGRQVDRTDRQFKGRLADVAVWGRALGASEIARLSRRETPRALARGARVDALAGVPAPVLHYAFEDASQVGFDSAPGAHHLEKAGTGAFTLVDSPLGGKALQFDAYNHAYLMCAAPPGVLPDDGRPFTVSLWVQTAAADARTWLKDAYTTHSPTFVSWGDPAKKTIDVMLAYWHDENVPHGFATPRCYVGGVNGALDKNGDAVLPCLREAAPARRWHHYAVVYDPAAGVRTYVDGVHQPALSQDGAFATRAASAGNVFYLGAKTTAPDATFRGALDEVKVYAAALDARQIRAVMRADAGALRVLPEGGDVAVAAGASLEVNGTDETVGALTGQGAVNLLSGALTLTNAASAFEGTLAGDGTLRLAAGAAWTLARAPTAFTGYVELAGGALTLPEGVEAIPATFRVTPLDTARETVCAGDVEIPDGTALALTAAYRGPFATARGRVIVAGGGSVTLPAPAAVGTWVIAQGAEDVRDDGAGALADRWRVTNLPATRTARFQISGGAFLCTVPPSGTLLLVR